MPALTAKSSKTAQNLLNFALVLIKQAMLCHLMHVYLICKVCLARHFADPHHH